MVTLIDPLFRLSRPNKRLIQLLTDATLIVFSFLAAMLLRLDSWAFMHSPAEWITLTVIVPLSLFIFVRLGFYRAVIRYLTHKAVEAVIIGVAISAVCLWLFSAIFNLPVPRSVPFIYAMLSVFTIGGVRFALRAIYLNGQKRQKTRVVIYGAGAAGRQLASSLLQGCEYQPVAFVDDSSALQDSAVHGLKVYAPSKLRKLLDSYGAKKVLLALPSASRTRRREILCELEPLGVSVKTIPGMACIVSGKSKISEVHNVAVEDLLGRDPSPPDPSLMGAKISGKVVMVTGAGGSIGSELCRQIIRQRPSRLLLLELSEFGLYSIEQDLKQLSKAEGLDVPLVPLLGSVQHGHRQEAIMKKFGVHTVYHAAAYKHVPMVEGNVIEGIRNNVFGTLYTAQAAVAAGVETFVLVSTDKAVRPTNVMGATKRLAELVCQALANSQKGTLFSMVRFGNVLGSSGSVVPLFRKQIQAGGPITVTHPEITRYFMTIPEAAQLVIQAGSMAKGGDVFVLDMGDPVNITELAKHMVRLSGLEPFCAHATKNSELQGDIEIVYTGLRPGEKLYEELLVGEDVELTRHKRILTAQEIYWAWPALKRLLDEMLEACRDYDQSTARSLLRAAPIAYSPKGEGTKPKAQTAPRVPELQEAEEAEELGAVV